MKKEFLNFFKIVNPKFIIYPVYINHECFAATLAARELELITIEMQHGVYSLPLYVYYQKKTPPEGYSLLPDYFFSWDNAQAKLINNWSQKTNTHKALSYGLNPINYWKQNKDNFHDIFFQFLNHFLNDSKLIHVLFTISDSIDKKLTTLIESTKGSCFWYIRNHPRANNQVLINNLISDLQEKKCTNYEITNSTNCLLYPLLEKVDYHITISSSVACESIYLGIPTIIISAHGRILYEPLYDKEPMLFVCEDVSTILKMILVKPSKQNIVAENKINYFEDFILNNHLL